jgi:hypothetical protein
MSQSNSRETESLVKYDTAILVSTSVGQNKATGS